MKQILCCLPLLVALLCACSINKTASVKPLPTLPGPNAFVVVGQAPVIDATTGKRAGTAYPGFALALHNAVNGKAEFSMAFLNDSGDQVREVKAYWIDTKYMQKQYIKPQAAIMMISTDMIRVHKNAAISNDRGEVLLRFADAIGPFLYIQKTDKGYMFTVDINVVFVKACDADLLLIKMPKN